MNTHLSSHNYIASELFNEAARQLDEMRDSEDNSARVSSVIILTMAALESFLNSYFHKLAFQLKKKELLNTIETGRDGNGRFIPTKDKILTWPQLVSGKSIEPTSIEYINFDKVRDLRDKLVHYKPDEMKWGHPQDSLKFVPDHKIDFYKFLTKEKGIQSFQAILDLIGAISGREGVHKNVFIANWSGRWPDQMPLISRKEDGNKKSED